MHEAISIEPQGRAWAVKHNGGYLGHARGRADTLCIARTLVDWLTDGGRCADLVLDERTRAGA